MPHARAKFGSRGEDLAVEYLHRKGYRVLERNVRTPVGELDLVCEAPRSPKFWRRRELVFVEVKARATDAFGIPEEAVTAAKQRHLVRAAQWYVASHREFHGSPFRIDVVAIAYGRGEPEMRHLIAAVGEI